MKKNHEGEDVCMMKVMENNTIKKYVLVNEDTDAIVECTEKYLVQWISRGFHISKIVYRGKEDSITKLRPQ